jgi:uncharacterized protein (DUF58 family)
MVGVRDYVYGDDLRRVHWKATARAQKLQSKIYEPTTVYNLVIFLNSDSKLDAHYALHQEWQELAICAAASIANWGLDEGYAVGLYSNSIMYLPEYGMTTLPKTWDEQDSGEEEKPVEQTLLKYFSQKRVQIPPASHANQRRKIMEALARIQSSFGNRLEDLIEQERVGLPVGTTVVVITSSVSDPLLDALRHLKRAGHAVTLLLTGDQQIQFRLPDIPLHYLGGDETWQRLSAWYTVAEHAESQQTRQYAPVSAGLSL